MIIFKKVTARNFLSIGNNPIEVQLNTHNTTALLGKNGAGKSTIIDGITFGLFGRAYRNINRPGLINSINQKQLLVTLEFSIGKKEYKIVRGMKPNIFEIWENGSMINQDPSVKDYQKVLEQQILKMNFRAFAQIAAVGSSAYIPFMKLTPGARREFIEDLLDIKIFSTMNSQLKEEIRTKKDELKEVDAQIKLLREKIALQESFIAKQETEKKESAKNIQDDIDKLEAESVAHIAEVEAIQAKIDAVQAQTAKFDSLDEQLSDVKSHRRNLESTVKTISSEKEWYQTIEECPKCKQSIAHDHKEHIIQSAEAQLKKHEDELQEKTEQLSELEKQYNEWQKLLDSLNGLNRELNEANKHISSNTAVIRAKTKMLTHLNTENSNITADKTKLKEFAKEILAADKSRKVIQETMHYQAAAIQLLQDTGIKAKVIKQYVPVINKLVNKYLDKLNFFCQFTLDENFNEIVKSRHRDTFVYDNFSAGQQLRIDISLLLTWIHIAEAKNSAACNILFADEILEKMDEEGLSLIIDLLKMQPNKNIFVITHREGMISKFDDAIDVVMKNNFTEIA